MTDEYGPYDLLDEIDFGRCLAANPGAVSALMFDVCARFSGSLPDVVLAGLDEARAFHSGASTVTSLEKARVACWNALGDRSCDFEDAAVCRIRAALCTMYPDVDDPFDTVHNFVDFALAGGMAEADLLALMQLHLTSVPT